MSLACLRSPDCLPYTSRPSPPVMSSVYTTVSTSSLCTFCPPGPGVRSPAVTLWVCLTLGFSVQRLAGDFLPWVAVEISISLLLYFEFACGSCTIWLILSIYGLSVGWVENIWEEIVSVLDMCGLFIFLSSVPLSYSKATMCWLVLPTCGNLESPKKRASIEELARSSLPTVPGGLFVNWYGKAQPTVGGTIPLVEGSRPHKTGDS